MGGWKCEQNTRKNMAAGCFTLKVPKKYQEVGGGQRMGNGKTAGKQR